MWWSWQAIEGLKGPYEQQIVQEEGEKRRIRELNKGRGRASKSPTDADEWG